MSKIKAEEEEEKPPSSSDSEDSTNLTPSPKSSSRLKNNSQNPKNLINNSGIDFSKSGWSTQATKYLKERGELWNKLIFKCIRKYYPEFLQREDVWKRKGSKI